MHTKTRSDYHDLQESHDYSAFHYTRWLKPLLFIGIGFIMGLMYNKPAPEDIQKPILMSEQTKTNASTIPKYKKNQTPKGAVISSKA